MTDTIIENVFYILMGDILEDAVSSRPYQECGKNICDMEHQLNQLLSTSDSADLLNTYNNKVDELHRMELLSAFKFGVRLGQAFHK